MRHTPIYVIVNTTPWPSLSDNTEWTDCDFEVTINTFDEVARGVRMRPMIHVTQYRRTRRSLDGRNPIEYEFIGTARFADDRVVTVHGSINTENGMGSFDDMSE